MQLYLIGYQLEDSSNWVHVVRDKYPTDDEAKDLICEDYGIELEDFDDDIHDFWINTINKIDGFNIKLEKDLK